MPLYDYQCEACGPFRSWESMMAATCAIPCPDCAEPAPRSVSAPFLANMNPHSRIAHQRNEKSAHEPQVTTRERMSKQGKKKHPHAGGGHHHGHGHKHSHGSGRPWMIGH